MADTATAVSAGSGALAASMTIARGVRATLLAAGCGVIVATCGSTPVPPTTTVTVSVPTVLSPSATNAVVVPTSEQSPSPSTAPEESNRLPIPASTFESSAFPTVSNRRIPARYTCDGADRSPPLDWDVELPNHLAPAAYAIIVTDADAHGAVQWVVAGISGDRARLPAGAGDAAAANGLLQGHNDFGTLGYVEPCPPPGRSHRYEFSLMAFASAPTLPDHPTADEMRAAAATSATIITFSAFYGR